MSIFSLQLSKVCLRNERLFRSLETSSNLQIFRWILHSIKLTGWKYCLIKYEIVHPMLAVQPEKSNFDIRLQILVSLSSDTHFFLKSDKSKTKKK